MPPLTVEGHGGPERWHCKVKGVADLGMCGGPMQGIVGVGRGPANPTRGEAGPADVPQAWTDDWRLYVEAGRAAERSM